MNTVTAVELLDAGNAEDLRCYEEGFHRAFLPRSNPGIRAIWLWDDAAGRLRTCVPYDEQVVFFLRDADGGINTACALGTTLHQFQSGAYGFARPAAEPRWCETLATFNNDRGALKAVYEHARQTMLARGYCWNYATCAEPLLRWNQRLGWEVVGQSVTNGQLRYFLRMPLQRPFMP